VTKRRPSSRAGREYPMCSKDDEGPNTLYDSSGKGNFEKGMSGWSGVSARVQRRVKWGVARRFGRRRYDRYRPGKAGDSEELCRVECSKEVGKESRDPFSRVGVGRRRSSNA